MIVVYAFFALGVWRKKYLRPRQGIPITVLMSHDVMYKPFLIDKEQLSTVRRCLDHTFDCFYSSFFLIFSYSLLQARVFASTTAKRASARTVCRTRPASTGCAVWTAMNVSDWWGSADTVVSATSARSASKRNAVNTTA